MTLRGPVAAFVDFSTASRHIDDLIIKRANAFPDRNSITSLGGMPSERSDERWAPRFRWVRPLTADGRGVKNGNQITDFTRFVADSLNRFAFSTFGNARRWPVDLRAMAHQYVEIFNCGVIETQAEYEEILRVRITIEVEVLPTVTS
jgi:hypothetical protein